MILFLFFSIFKEKNMYLNFILTVLCLILLAFLISGILLVKKLRKWMSKNPQFINPQALDQTKKFADSMKQVGNLFNNMPKK